MPKIGPRFTTVVLLALFFAIALYLRAYLPYDKVFVGDWIKFTGTDPYYHMRLVDNLAHNFPRFFTFDPYFIYPEGSSVGNIHFFDWLLASIIWLIGLGTPSQHTIDVVGVYFPAVLGALTAIPVYFIGKELFGRWAGIIAAGLVILSPGEFLGRSILGFTDHHVAETLFTTIAMLFLILAIKTARQRNVTFDHLRHREWSVLSKPAIYSLLAGIFLGIYLLTFLGGLLFVFIIAVYIIIQFIIDHLRGKSTDYLCLIAIILFIIAGIMFLPTSPSIFYVASLTIALLISPALNVASRLMISMKMKRGYYPLTLIILGLGGLGIFYLLNPGLLRAMLEAFSIFMPKGVSLTTTEMQPFLFPGGKFSLTVAWGNFTTSFFLGLFALLILIYLVIKHGSAENSLLVVWSLVILAATLGQRRFAYYLVVNISLLTSYLSWQTFSLLGFKESTATRAVPIPPRAMLRRAKPRGGGSSTTTRVALALVAVIIFFIVLFPNIPIALAVADQAPFAPSNAWMSALTWMKENTPEPLGDSELYYQLETSHQYRSLDWLQKNVANPSGDPKFYIQLAEKYKYPASAYGVLSWWDYGYWISRIAHRIPNSNPSQDPQAVTRVAAFFTTQNESSANEMVQKMDSSYIILDYETAVVDPRNATGKFWAVILWAGEKQDDFLDFYVLPQEGKLIPMILYYPEYYRSFSTRLYNFDGKAVTPESTIVISYQGKVSQEGITYKEITSIKQFPSYQEAEAYRQSQASGNYKIVGNNPFISPVPLEAPQHFQLVYTSNETVSLPYVPTLGTVAEVKIFEYRE